MLQLGVYGEKTALTAIGQELERRGALHHATLTSALRAEHAQLSGEVSPESADELLAFLRARGVPAGDIVLTRSEQLGPTRHRDSGALVWTAVFAQARVNASVVSRYLVFMIAAGVIAGFGVVDVNGILIVGAMAVSPDMLPITAACVGIVGRRRQLARRALITLTIGFLVASLAAGLLTLVLRAVGAMPDDFRLEEAALHGLTDVNVTTVVVAFVSGVAGMLAVETRASAAVGVAISVTTIPAAAFLGVAFGVADLHEAWGALGVLAANVVMILLGGVLTLLVQRRIARAARH